MREVQNIGFVCPGVLQLHFCQSLTISQLLSLPQPALGKLITYQVLLRMRLSHTSHTLQFIAPVNAKAPVQVDATRSGLQYNFDWGKAGLILVVGPPRPSQSCIAVQTMCTVQDTLAETEFPLQLEAITAGAAWRNIDGGAFSPWQQSYCSVDNVVIPGHTS